ncbi:MAG: UbiH/UbiF family hydroxylase [Rhodocyclaceae bacterium]|jgi:2-octaprenylphenol hydroxylase|nr:UbiH/UbiF family hydroxylase [Rhodocyclaceae bacterium]MBK6908710.1 UbiH/UbiF family hydroxylase [Rhodocyclaceae bacterium]
MHVDVIIVGGGLAGTALAVALRSAKLSVALVEGKVPTRTAGWDARIYAISPANAHFLESIGIWSHLDRARLQAVEHMSIYGDTDGRLQFSAYDSGIGELAWICESSLLQCELWESVKRQANVQLFCPARPAAMTINADQVTLQLDDGRQMTCALLVGADGADSWVRQSAGIDAIQRPYDQLGVVANFETEKPHDNTAFQWFRGSDVLAWLPLPGKRISMVWSIATEPGRDLIQCDAEEFSQRVEQVGAARLGKLSLMAAPAAFPLRLMRARQSAQARLVLIGDAAHAIHPLSGHGINLGFQDAASLADVLLQKPEYQDCGSLALLRRHERARKEEVLALQTVTDTLHRLFQAPADPLAPWVSVRNIGMNVTNQLPLLKDLLVRYALAS